MANGSTTFDKALEAIKQLGAPIVIAGVLLWYMVTKWDAMLTKQEATLTGLELLMTQGRQMQLESRQTQMEMREAQQHISRRVEAWMQQGCQPHADPP